MGRKSIRVEVERILKETAGYIISISPHFIRGGEEIGEVG